MSRYEELAGFEEEAEKILVEWEAFLAIEARTEPDPVRRNVFWARATRLIDDAVTLQRGERREKRRRALFSKLIDPLTPEHNDRKFFKAEGTIASDQRPLAILVAPKTQRVYVIALTYNNNVDVMVPMREGLLVSVGTGYFDAKNAASEETDCIRVHTPEGVVQQDGGLGLLLYSGLALQAAADSYDDKTPFGACISSCGPYGRSDEATKWWNNQVRRGLAREKSEFRTSKADEAFDVCQWIDVKDVMRLGIVLWRHPSLKWLDSVWRKAPLEVLLATRVDHIPDESFLRFWVRVLEREGATDEQVARYLVDNGHGALIGVKSAPKRFVSNKRDAFARFYGDLVEVD